MPAPTPYNSIYSMMAPPTSDSSHMSSKKKNKKGPCCLHGDKCPNFPDQSDDTAPYVNLVPVDPVPIPKAEFDSIREGSSKSQKSLRRILRGMQALQLGEKISKKAQKERAKMKRKRRQEGLLFAEEDRSSKSSAKSISTKTRPSRKAEKKKKAKKRSSKKKEEPFDTLNNLAQSVKIRPLIHEKDEVFVGIKTCQQAEDEVKIDTDFRLYYRIGQTYIYELEPSLPLFIVYRMTNGSYRHYRIREQVQNSQKVYIVEYGDMNAPAHPSIDHLIRFYQTQFVAHDSEGEQHFDAFY